MGTNKHNEIKGRIQGHFWTVK